MRFVLDSTYCALNFHLENYIFFEKYIYTNPYMNNSQKICLGIKMTDTDFLSALIII